MPFWYYELLSLNSPFYLENQRSWYFCKKRRRFLRFLAIPIGEIRPTREYLIILQVLQESKDFFKHIEITYSLY